MGLSFYRPSNFQIIMLIINIVLLLYIYNVKDIEQTISNINSEIYNYKKNVIYIAFVSIIGLILTFGLMINSYYYKEFFHLGLPGIFLVCIVFILIYIYHLKLYGDYVSQDINNLTNKYKNLQLKNYTLKNASIIILCLIPLYLGYITQSVRGKIGLTLFIWLYMVYVFMKIWDFTIERDMYIDLNMSKLIGTKHRYIYIYTLLIIFFILFLLNNIKIYVTAYIFYILILTLYNIIIIIRKNTLVYNYGDILLPVILLCFYAILNYKDFQEESLNTKFVYGLGFMITVFLLYIITNTDDIKIKSFITIFLVIIYNMLAIVYGGKDCDLPGFKLLTRVLKWTIVVSIIILILWNNFFRSSINDNLNEIITSSGSDISDTDKLERQLKDEKNKDNTEIKEGDKADKRVQLQKELNRIYETRARENI